MSEPALTRIGPYRVVRVVGTGGWSTVYEVRDGAGRALALKRLRDDLPPAAVARFQREADSLRRVDHPGVLRLLDAGHDGAPYLVTPLVDGHSLRGLVPAGGLGVEAALLVLTAAAEAVAALHAAGLVHRDLKPENLMLTAAGDVIVIDLGLALGPDHSRHTAEDAVTGSVPYLAPEQIEDRAPSPASDVWALAVVLVEAITGRRPFQRERGSEEVAAILAGRAPRLDELDRRCPASLADLVARCLEPSPARRPADAGALARALAGQIDWIEPAAHASERAFLVRDPDGFVRARRATRVALEAAAAERALAAGDRFAAGRALDRALAYAPDEPALRSLLDRLMAPSNLPVPLPEPARPAPRRWPWLAAAVAVLLLIGLLAAQPWARDGAATVAPASPAPPPPDGTLTRPAHVRPSRPAPP